MINIKIIYKILGSLLFIEAILLFLCFVISLVYSEDDRIAFGIATVLVCAVGFILKYKGRKAQNHMSRRDGYLIVSSSWILFTLFGMLPFLISGHIPSVCDAFFETMSGFTSTGASVVNNLDTFPHALLFWRSFTQWIGGLGIVFFTLAILPSIGIGDVKLFAAEATGPRHDKLHPRIRTTAKWIWGIYLFQTLACTGILFLCGMGLFDSINHALATTSSGGFSTMPGGIMTWQSPVIEYVLIVFMFLAGINYTLLYLFLLKGRVSHMFTDSEFRGYLAIVVSASAFIALFLYFQAGYGVEQAIRSALFQVVSIQTTTGFCSDNFMMWPSVTWSVLALVMCIGACAGSTCGGLKSIRFVMLCKTAYNEFRHILHPKAVVPVRINHSIVTSSIERTLISFTVLFFLLVVLGTICLKIMGLCYMDAFSVSLSALSNCGPAIGPSFGSVHTWYALPDAGKWLCSFLMLAGRLEIFSLLLPFLPRFWQEN